MSDKVLDATCSCTARAMALNFAKYPETNTYVINNMFSNILALCQRDSGLDATRMNLPGP